MRWCRTCGADTTSWRLRSQLCGGWRSQWDDGPKAGFSTADPSRLYLPVDPDPTRPTVAAQEQDPNSTLTLVKRLIALRKSTPALGSRVATRGLHDGYPFADLRGETHLVVVNPQRDQATLSTGELSGAASLLASGISIVGDTLTAEGFAFGIFALPGHA